MADRRDDRDNVDTVRRVVETAQSLTIDAALARATLSIAHICERALDGASLTVAEAEQLLAARNDDQCAVVKAADVLRRQLVGDTVTFVITRNINFTNVCHMGCRFCGFAKRKDADDAEFLSNETIVARAQEAVTRGATEVCLQGGLHPHMSGHHYGRIVTALKRALPELHVHAFSPFEIWYGVRKTRLALHDFLHQLRDAGIGSLPGTAAEILDTEVRKRLTQDKLSTEEWVTIISAAHEVGIPTTSTMMYGHVDGPTHWARHMDVLRTIQRRTGGFTEFVPLGFVHYESPLYVTGGDVRPGPTPDEHIAIHATARLFFGASLPNLQASWVKMGPMMARLLLAAGVNDLGGTLMNETISRAAGAFYGQEMTPRDMVLLAHSVGRPAAQRTTLYDIRTHYPPGTMPMAQQTLVARDERATVALYDLLSSGESTRAFS